MESQAHVTVAAGMLELSWFPFLQRQTSYDILVSVAAAKKARRRAHRREFRFVSSLFKREAIFRSA